MEGKPAAALHLHQLLWCAPPARRVPCSVPCVFLAGTHTLIKGLHGSRRTGLLRTPCGFPVVKLSVVAEGFRPWGTHPDTVICAFSSPCSHPRRPLPSRLKQLSCSVDSGEGLVLLECSCPLSPILSHGLQCHLSNCSSPCPCPGLTCAVSAPRAPSSSESEGPGMEFRFSTHQPSNNSIGLDSLDWLWPENSHVLPALVA